MILRRFIQHVSEQNWFAVGLDVLVVIVGIFLGMQVTDWNEDRKEGQRSEEIEARIRANLLEDVRNLEARLIYWNDVVEFGKTGISWLETGNAGTNSGWQILLSLYQASNMWRYTSNITTFDELQSAGELALIRDTGLREDLTQYYQIMRGRRSGLIYDLTPEYRRVIRGAIPYDIGRAIHRNCTTENTLDQALIACDPVVGEEEIAGILAGIAANPDVLPTLRYWISSAEVGIGLAQMDLVSARNLAERFGRRP